MRHLTIALRRDFLREPQGRMSFQLETGAAYNLTVDQDINAISTNPKRARFQVVDVLTAIYSEVRAGISRHAVN